jgi:hypothetical protein
MNVVFWDVTPYGSCKNRRFGGTYPLHHQCGKFLVAAYFVPSSPILSTLMMEVIQSTKTSVLKRTTRHHISEDDILHSHGRRTLKSYIVLTGWVL